MRCRDLRVTWSGALMTAAIVFCMAKPASAQGWGTPDPFDRGSVRTTFVAGWGSAVDNSYAILGLGAGYYLLDGLDLGLSFEAWVGSSPGIYRVTPALTYAIPVSETVRPYVGTFYRKTFVDGYDDQESYGFRGGLFFVQGTSLFGVGVVHDIYTDCDNSVFSCSETYPEVVFSIGF